MLPQISCSNPRRQSLRTALRPSYGNRAPGRITTGRVTSPAAARPTARAPKPCVPPDEFAFTSRRTLVRTIRSPFDPCDCSSCPALCCLSSVPSPHGPRPRRPLPMSFSSPPMSAPSSSAGRTIPTMKPASKSPTGPAPAPPFPRSAPCPPIAPRST